MDYSKAKKLHPKLKVRNVKRLIAAIREADSLQLARAKAKREPLMVGNRAALCSDARIERAEGIGNRKVPLVFCMAAWMHPASTHERHVTRFGEIHAYSGSEPTCGTAACIAGFAGTLMPKSWLPAVEKAVRSDDCHRWESILAEFIGVDERTADEMTSTNLSHAGIYNHHVQPRHAVRLLENFLETGKVDWFKAMGRSDGLGGSTKAEMKALRRDAEALDAALAA